MKAFISYSHSNTVSLDIFHKHLALLKRDGILTTWADQQILAGGKVDKNISSALATADIFIALLSPDYIASNYCYETEFNKALEMQHDGNLIIVPVIIEPCDWLNTPFKDFKALPKDGKPISDWENIHTAFLDVIQNIRRLINSPEPSLPAQKKSNLTEDSPSRNYRVQKDFDSIEKMEFIEKTFHEVKEFIKRYMEEILQIENIKARILSEDKNTFECFLVNRNKIATESELKISIASERQPLMSVFSSSEKQITYSINFNNRNASKGFSLGFDQYHLFWSENIFYTGSRNKKEISSREIADIIWNEWLESVGIM